jgi:GDP-L-fucose synthase
VNLGSAFEISFKDLVHLIAEFTGFTGEIVWNITKPNSQQRRKLDTSRAEYEFGFKSQVNLRVGLKQTVDWYLEYHWRSLDT